VQIGSGWGREPRWKDARTERYMSFYGMERENVRLSHKVYIFLPLVERELEIRSDGVWHFLLFC
jgi:hypothetical protein